MLVNMNQLRSLQFQVEIMMCQRKMKQIEGSRETVQCLHFSVPRVVLCTAIGQHATAL